MISLFLCWSPVLLLIVLAVGFKRPALDLSIAGVVYTAALVIVVYDTPVSVALQAALDGALTTLPLLLVVFAGIFLSFLLMETGSLKRIAEWFLSGVKNAYHRELLIAMGVGNFMEGSSVIAELVAAPMLRATGLSPTSATALSVIGYAGLMTLEMAGIIVTVLALITNLPMYDLAMAAAWLSIPSTVMLAASIPFFLDGPVRPWRRMMLPIGCGFFVSGVALLAVDLVGVTVSGMLGGLALIVAIVLFGTRQLTWNRGIARDFTPFGFILVSLLLVNTVPILREWTFDRLTWTVRVIPIHAITFRPFFSAYLYLFTAGVLGVVLFRNSDFRLRALLNRSTTVGIRVSITMVLFGVMGQIIAFSGYDSAFELNAAHNIPRLIASGLESLTGGFYPVFVPFLGWVGTFLTGYGVASLMLFGPIQVETANLMGVSATWLSAGLAVGASIGSVSSPFKIALAAPMCGAMGKEGDILRRTIPLGIAVSLLLGIILWLIL